MQERNGFAGEAQAGDASYEMHAMSISLQCTKRFLFPVMCWGFGTQFCSETKIIIITTTTITIN